MYDQLRSTAVSRGAKDEAKHALEMRNCFRARLLGCT